MTPSKAAQQTQGTREQEAAKISYMLAIDMHLVLTRYQVHSANNDDAKKKPSAKRMSILVPGTWYQGM